MKKLVLLCLLIALPASAQEGGPDPAMIERGHQRAQHVQQQQAADEAAQKRLMIEMQRARDERANEVVVWRAEVARLNEEVAKLKAENDRLKAAQSDARSDGK